LFIALVLIVYTLYKNWPRPGVTQARALEVPAIGVSLKRGVASLFLPVLILGGIYGWFDLAPFGVDFAVVFTVPEAAAVSVVYALVVELLLHRELKLKHVPEVLVESATMMGSLFLILVIAISLNKFLVFEQVPEAATAWMLERVDSPFTFILMVNLFLLALGCVMDILSAILIVAPLLAPIAASYGIHPIHFGIMFIVNLEIGYLTPPMGINLFVASTVFERPILEVIRSVLPFLVIMLLCLAVVAWVPGLSLLFVE
jgi:C4-dicarboxylate transporter DctM subunit